MCQMKFGICNEIFEGWSMEDTMEYVAKTGYDCLEIAPFTISNYVTDITAAQRQNVKDLAAKHGIEISGIHWVLVKAEGMHMTHTDASIREKTAKYFVDLVDCCADFGGKSIIVGSPYQRNLMEGVSYDQAWEFVSAIREGRDCVPSFYHGMRSQIVAEAIVEAAASRRWIDVPG